MHLAFQSSWIFNKLHGEEKWGAYSHRDDPSGESEDYGHSFELMGGERRGNITAPDRSTAIRTMLRIDTGPEACVKK